ncbi:MAG: DUF1934 domain-containing protein [Clostridia bacterium]|nr:DUF1934 domain-containing protein [Clostridia bacterium]
MDAKRAIIRIRTETDDPAAAAETSVAGEITRTPEGVLLHYTEYLEEDATRVRLHARPGRALMRREGDWSTVLRFDEGVRRESRYQTPFGALAVAVCAREVWLEGDEEAGTLRLDYELLLAGNEPDRRRLTIRWEAAPC